MRLLIAAVAALTLASPAAAKPARPDLKLTRVSVGAGTAFAGTKITLGDTTKNAGRASARGSITSFYLSADRAKSNGDLRFGSRRIGRLRHGKSSRGSAIGDVPPALNPGRWFVIACADARKRIRESSERNNCRAAAPSLTVRAAPVAGEPPAGGNAPVIAGCQIFPADNPWNRDISQDPVDPMSDTYIRYMGSSPDADWNLRQDWGTGDEPFYGIPWVVVPASQPLVPITFDPSDNAEDESDPGPYPFPQDIPIEGGSPGNPNPPDGDRHALALQQGGNCTLRVHRQRLRRGRQ